MTALKSGHSFFRQCGLDGLRIRLYTSAPWAFLLLMLARLLPGMRVALAENKRLKRALHCCHELCNVSQTPSGNADLTIPLRKKVSSGMRTATVDTVIQQETACV